jgi:hypothetical protein
MPERGNFSPADIKPARRSVSWSQVNIGPRHQKNEQMALAD